MKGRLTFLEMRRKLGAMGGAALIVASPSPAGLYAQTNKRQFTHTVDLRLGREDALLDVLKSISEQFDSELRAISTAYTVGEILYNQQRYDDASRNFAAVVAKGRNYGYLSDSARIRLAQTQVLKGDYPAALRTLHDMVNSSNKYLASEALFVSAQSYLAMGLIDRAENAYQSIRATNSSYSAIQKVGLFGGLLAFAKGDYGKAISYFQGRSDIPSYYYSIAAYCQLKDIAKAVSCYQSLLSKAKQGLWVDRARILLGEAIYQTHDYDLAMTFFGPVSRRDAPPELRIMALYRLACVDFQKKNYTRCELTLQNLLKNYGNNPARADWTYLLATIPVYERDWSRTIQEEGRYNFSAHGVPTPHYIPKEQFAPEAEFRMLWAHMALGEYHTVIGLADKFFHRYSKNLLTGYALLLEGVAYDQTGNTDRAVDVYQTLVDLFPQSPAAGKAVYLMTLSLHRAQESDRIVTALNHLNESLQRSQELKNDEWRKNTLFWIAEGYYSIQDFPHAMQTYKRFVELAPNHPFIPYALEGLAASLAAQGPERLDEAKIYEQQAMARAQELNNAAVAADAKLQMGKIFFNQKDHDSAVAQLDAFVHDSTDSVRVAEAYYDSGLALYNQQFFTEALNRWKQVIDGYRNSPLRSLAYLQTGRTQFGLGHYDQAIAAFQALAANYPNSPESQEAQFQIIQSYYNKPDIRGAYQQLMAFKNAYPYDERIKGACEQLLSAYQGQTNANLHAGELSELLRCAPGSNTASSILWEQGAALFNKKDYASAQKFFQRIMLSYPNDDYAGQAYFYNAECYFFMNNMEEAAAAYKSFYINYPADKTVPQAMFQVGICFFNKKDFQKAAAAFNEFVQKFPQHALSRDAALNIALCFKKAFQLDDAIHSYQKYLTLFPGDAKEDYVRLQIGLLHATKGMYAQAIKDFEIIRPGTAERAEGQYHIGEAYENMHDEPGAKAAYQRLMSLGPRDNEFRMAGLLKLAKILENSGAGTKSLILVYQEIASSSKSQDVVSMARQKLMDLKGGQ